MTEDKDDFQYNNEAEDEMAQLHSLHIHMNAVGDVQRKLAAQALQESFKHCEECGDEIPEARRKAVLGVKYCVYCQELNEHRKVR